MDGDVIFPDGAARRLTRKELRLLYAGELKRVSRDGARHFNAGNLTVLVDGRIAR